MLEKVLDRNYRDKARNSLLTFFPKEKEIFAHHPYCDHLLVSNHGTLKNSVTGRIYNSHKNRNGYDCINVKYSNGKRMSTFVHRLVCDTFLGYFNNSDYIFEVNHIDGNKNNNTLYNLEWLTRKENLQHARDNKLFKSLKGEMSGNCKFTRQDCLDMIELYNSRVGILEIARLYSANRNTVSNIVRGKARVNE